jgi:hypothetical protein
VLPLRSLELRHTNIDDYVLLRMLPTLAFDRLTPLGLKGIGDNQKSWKSCNFAHLLDALEKYLPNLEYLACIIFDVRPGDDFKSFRSLRALSHLQALEVDFKLMTAPDGQGACLEYKAMFPDSLARRQDITSMAIIGNGREIDEA